MMKIFETYASMFYNHLVLIVGKFMISVFTVLVLLVLLFMILFFRELKWKRRRDKEINRATLLNEKIQNSQSLEDNLKVLLEILSKEISASYYAFYVIDNRGEKFMMRAAIHPFDDFSKVGPSYSGLALPRKEVYIPPTTLELDMESVTLRVMQIEETEFVLLQTLSRRAVVRIGPIRKLNRKTKQNLRTQFKMMEPRIEELIDISRQKMVKRVTITADSAVRTLASVATSLDSALEVMMRSLIGEAGGLGGVLVDTQGNQLLKVDFEDHLESLFNKIRGDQKFHGELWDWLRNRDYHMVSSNDTEYYSLPEYIVLQGIGALVAISIPNRGILIMFFDLDFDQAGFLKQGISKVSMLSEVIQRISKEQTQHKWMAKLYSQQLQRIADAVEIINPYTVGYSKMVARFSLAIGSELGLSEQTMEDLALAAYFSNVGTLGMDHRVFNKQGRLSETEFELVKLHSEIGAAMILIATGNRLASEFVLYHHERMDGNGYPAGLQEDEIPIGARIIHTVQFLLAKINGRAWRSPVTFIKTMEILRDMSGSQLDRRIVDALFNWYYKKATDSIVSGKSLDTCYHLCSTPESICISCPVYKKVQTSSLNCWEVGSNLCQSHGRTCDTCFVRTEFIDRERLLRMTNPLAVKQL